MFSRLKSLASAPGKWKRRTREEKRLFLEAFLLLGIARFVVKTMPFRWLAKTIGRHQHESETMIGESDGLRSTRIGRAVCSASGNTPWESVCLPQAITAQWMLKRRQIPATLYLGVTKEKTDRKKLKAHAWLRCGNTILTGAAGHRDFTVVSTFATGWKDGLYGN